jgi:predicted transcriptional regulator
MHREVQIMPKTITLRLPEEEFSAFDFICQTKGYSKTGKIREYIRDTIKNEMQIAKFSAAEWMKVKEGIEEIERGEHASFEQIKNDFRKRKMENR